MCLIRRYDLPAKSMPFKAEIEDTFVHNTLHTLFQTVFSPYNVEWENKQADGSKERRRRDGAKEGLRPDLQLSHRGRVLLFLEVKPPGPSLQESVYLSDRWKLFNLAKDEIDKGMREHVHIPFVVVVQVFGKSCIVSYNWC